MRRLSLVLCAVVALIGAIAISPKGAHAQTFTAHSVHNLNQTHPAAALVVDCPDCDGQDPYHYNPGGFAAPCYQQGARIVSSAVFQTQDILILNVYSDGCGTNWAEIHQGGTGIANANITRADGEHYDGTWYGSFVYSPMVYAPYLAAQACGSINNAPGGCSTWV